MFPVSDYTDNALRVAAFLLSYSEGGQWGALSDPLNTITTRNRLALVTVTIQGTPYVVVNIGLRMWQPDELFRVQDFAGHCMTTLPPGHALTDRVWEEGD